MFSMVEGFFGMNLDTRNLITVKVKDECDMQAE